MGESYDDLGPGLHVLRETEPLKRAGAMAAHLHAELCATLPQVDALVAERERLPVVDATTLQALRTLATRLERTDRIAGRTRDRAVDEVARRMSATSGVLAIHPETVRERAAALERAQADLDAAARALTEDDLPAEDPVGEEPVVPASNAAGDADGSERVPGHARRSRAIGVLLASFGLGLVLVGTGIAPLWLALIVPFAAALWAMRYLQTRDEDDTAGRRAVSNLLAEVAASTDEVFGARQASKDRSDHRLALELRRDRAEEDVRVARRAWEDLAGKGTDVADLDDVIRRFDPQHEDAELLASETVGVRAVVAVQHQLRQRWAAFWHELGRDAPPTAGAATAVEALAAQVTRPIVLVGPAAARGAELARLAPAAIVVVLDGPDEGAG